MMGCSVNLSARLMASAPKNTIQVKYCGESAPFEATMLQLLFFNTASQLPLRYGEVKRNVLHLGQQNIRYHTYGASIRVANDVFGLNRAKLHVAVLNRTKHHPNGFGILIAHTACKYCTYNACNGRWIMRCGRGRNLSSSSRLSRPSKPKDMWTRCQCSALLTKF